METIILKLLEPSTLASMATLVVALRSLTQIEKVHVLANSMKDELVQSTAKAAHAQGLVEGAAEERARPSPSPGKTPL